MCHQRYVDALDVDASTRKTFLANAFNLIKATKGKNVILSSGAESLLELRRDLDVVNMYMILLIIGVPCSLCPNLLLETQFLNMH
jgi:RNase P/RNase MRP subunit p30